MDIGDRFLFLNELGGGSILEIDRGRILVQTDDGRELWVDQREILPDYELTSLPTIEEEPELPSGHGWVVGAKVRYLTEAGEGRIVDEGNRGFLVLDEDGFERWFQKSHLVLVDHTLESILKSSETENKDRTVRSYNPRPKKQSQVLEVDLHIHELLEFDSHLSDHEKLVHQLNVARHQIEKARRGHYKKVILIHGVGKGVLKEKIHEMLSGMERLEFYDASLQKYGKGATEIEFR